MIELFHQSDYYITSSHLYPQLQLEVALGQIWIHPKYFGVVGKLCSNFDASGCPGLVWKWVRTTQNPRANPCLLWDYKSEDGPLEGPTLFVNLKKHFPNIQLRC